MVTTDPLTVYIPLLILAILKICDIGREMDLKTVQGGRPWDFIGIPHSITYKYPALGRFVFLFGSIELIMLYSISFTAASDTDLILRLTVGAVIIGIWLMVPIFMIDEYDDIPVDDKIGWPQSYGIHFAYVIVISILVSTSLLFPSNRWGDLLSLIWFGVILWIIERHIRRYLIQLDVELEQM